jgi:chromosome segregation ATPase
MSGCSSATPVSSWPQIQETISEFRADFANLERLVDGLFDEMERLSGELEQKARQVAAECERVAERQRQLATQQEEAQRIGAQLERQESQLSEVLSQLSEVKQQVGRRIEPTVDERLQRFSNSALQQDAADPKASQEQRESEPQGGGRGDPVVSCVVAQLEKLQRSATRRGRDGD